MSFDGAAALQQKSSHEAFILASRHLEVSTSLRLFNLQNKTVYQLAKASPDPLGVTWTGAAGGVHHSGQFTT
jgi:hypothetical protein